MCLSAASSSGRDGGLTTEMPELASRRMTANWPANNGTAARLDALALKSTIIKTVRRGVLEGPRVLLYTTVCVRGRALPADGRTHEEQQLLEPNVQHIALHEIAQHWTATSRQGAHGDKP